MTSNNNNPSDIRSWMQMPSESSTEHDLERIERACNTIVRLCSNIIDDPTNEKFRKVPFGADAPPAIRAVQDACLANVKPADRPHVFAQFMRSIGFRTDPNEKLQKDPQSIYETAPKQILHLFLDPVTPLGGLDRAVVAATAVADECTKYREVMRDRELQQLQKFAAAAKLAQQNDLQSRMEFYRQFAEERRCMKAWAETICRSVDTASSDPTTGEIGVWNAAHDAAVQFFQSFGSVSNGDGGAVSFDRTKFHPLFFATVVSAVLKELAELPHQQRHEDDAAAASPPSSLNDVDRAISLFAKCLHGLRARVKESSNTLLIIEFPPKNAMTDKSQQQQQQQEEYDQSQFLLTRVCVPAILERFENLKFEKQQAALSSMKGPSEAAAARDKRVAQEAEKKRFVEEHGETALAIDHELMTCALGLINDISAYAELCWQIEGAQGVVAPHKKIAQQYLADFRKGTMSIAHLHELKKQWALRYEKEKSKRGIAYTAAKPPPPPKVADD